jgi:hypothetical protein
MQTNQGASNNWAFRLDSKILDKKEIFLQLPTGTGKTDIVLRLLVEAKQLCLIANAYFILTDKRLIDATKKVLNNKDYDQIRHNVTVILLSDFVAKGDHLIKSNSGPLFLIFDEFHTVIPMTFYNVKGDITDYEQMLQTKTPGSVTLHHHIKGRQKCVRYLKSTLKMDYQPQIIDSMVDNFAPLIQKFQPINRDEISNVYMSGCSKILDNLTQKTNISNKPKTKRYIALLNILNNFAVKPFCVFLSATSLVGNPIFGVQILYDLIFNPLIRNTDLGDNDCLSFLYDRIIFSPKCQQQMFPAQFSLISKPLEFINTKEDISQFSLMPCNTSFNFEFTTDFSLSDVPFLPPLFFYTSLEQAVGVALAHIYCFEQYKKCVIICYNPTTLADLAKNITETFSQLQIPTTKVFCLYAKAPDTQLQVDEFNKIPGDEFAILAYTKFFQAGHNLRNVYHVFDTQPFYTHLAVSSIQGIGRCRRMASHNIQLDNKKHIIKVYIMVDQNQIILPRGDMLHPFEAAIIKESFVRGTLRFLAEKSTITKLYQCECKVCGHQTQPPISEMPPCSNCQSGGQLINNSNDSYSPQPLTISLVNKAYNDIKNVITGESTCRKIDTYHISYIYTKTCWDQLACILAKPQSGSSPASNVNKPTSHHPIDDEWLDKLKPTTRYNSDQKRCNPTQSTAKMKHGLTRGFFNPTNNSSTISTFPTGRPIMINNGIFQFGHNPLDFTFSTQFLPVHFKNDLTTVSNILDFICWRFTTTNTDPLFCETYDLRPIQVELPSDIKYFFFISDVTPFTSITLQNEHLYEILADVIPPPSAPSATLLCPNITFLIQKKTPTSPPSSDPDIILRLKDKYYNIPIEYNAHPIKSHIIHKIHVDRQGVYNNILSHYTNTSTNLLCLPPKVINGVRVCPYNGDAKTNTDILQTTLKQKNQTLSPKIQNFLTSKTYNIKAKCFVLSVVTYMHMFRGDIDDVLGSKNDSNMT